MLDAIRSWAPCQMWTVPRIDPRSTPHPEHGHLSLAVDSFPAILNGMITALTRGPEPA